MQEYYKIHDIKAATAGAILATAVIAGIITGIAIDDQLSDHTMTQEQANRLAEPVNVYMCEGVAEDNLYINNQDTGKVNFVPATDCE